MQDWPDVLSPLMHACNLLRRLRACTGVLSASKLQHLFMLMMVMKVSFHMGHHCILTSFALLLAPEAQGMEGQWYTSHYIDEKLNLQFIYYYSYVVVVNMVNVTSNHSKYEALIYCSGNVTYNHIYQHIISVIDSKYIVNPTFHLVSTILDRSFKCITDGTESKEIFLEVVMTTNCCNLYTIYKSIDWLVTKFIAGRADLIFSGGGGGGGERTWGGPLSVILFMSVGVWFW